MDSTSILWLVGIVVVAAVVLTAIFKGRGVQVEGKGMKLKVDGPTPGSATPGIKAHGIKAGRDVVATDETGKGIDAENIEARQDVRLQSGTNPDPKEN